MTTYEFHWLDGTVERSDGHSVSEAFTLLGYGSGALTVLDYFKEIKEATVDDCTE